MLLLTGSPGVGKSTCIKKVVGRLQQAKVRVKGFYTEEVRDPATGQRAGFDVVSFCGKTRSILARVGGPWKNHVGRYSVDVTGFENTALPLMRLTNDEEKPDVIVIDEIGKMELLSKQFVQQLHALISTDIPVLATITLKGGGSVVDDLKRRGTVHTLTEANRNEMPDLLVQEVLKQVKPEQ